MEEGADTATIQPHISRNMTPHKHTHDSWIEPNRIKWTLVVNAVAILLLPYVWIFE